MDYLDFLDINIQIIQYKTIAWKSRRHNIYLTYSWGENFEALLYDIKIV